MANPEKSPEPSNKKPKTKQTQDDDSLDFFLEPLFQSLGSLNHNKSIETAPAEKHSVVGASRYENAPSLYDLVKFNLLNTTSPTLAASSSAPTSSDNTIPQKRSLLQITQEESEETETQYYTPPPNFTHTQTSHDGRVAVEESVSKQTMTTKTGYINTITTESHTLSLSEPSTSNARDVTFHSNGSNSQSAATDNTQTTHTIEISDDDNSDMWVGEDAEMMVDVEEGNTTQNTDRDEPSTIVKPDSQKSTPQRRPGTPLSRTTSHHSLELYEDIDDDDDDDEEDQEFVDTNEALIDVDAEDGSSQSNDEFYDVKESFSATVSMASTPTTAEDADGQLQDDADSVIVNAIEAVQDDVEDSEQREISDQGDSTEEGELAAEEDELADEDQIVEEAEGAQVDDVDNQEGSDQSREPGEISEGGETILVESSQVSGSNERASSAERTGDQLDVPEVGELNTNQGRMDNVQSDTNHEDVQTGVIEGTSVNDREHVQQPSEVEETRPALEQDLVSAVDQAVGSPSVEDEQLIQDDPLQLFGSENDQLIEIEEVHLLMDHQEEQAVLHPDTTHTIQNQHEPSEDADADDQQVQANDADDSDQQVINDNTSSQLLESDRVHSFLLEEIEEILQQDSEEAEQEAIDEFTIEDEQQQQQQQQPSSTQDDAGSLALQDVASETEITGAASPFIESASHDSEIMSHLQADMATAEQVDDIQMEESDPIEDASETESHQSQAASVVEDSVQDIASVRDSFAMDVVQSQILFSQSEEVEEYELEDSDEEEPDTEEHDVQVKVESRRPADDIDVVPTRVFIDLTSDSEDEQAAEVQAVNEQVQDEQLEDVDSMDYSLMDYDDDEDDLMDDAMLGDENEQQDIQTQEPVAVPLNDIPLDCLNADMGAIPKTVCNMDIPPYLNVAMWWYDALDSNQKGIVYLFGKVFDDQQEKYVSCCVRIKNIVRELYILPRQFKIDDEGNPTTDIVELNDVQQELTTLLERKRVSTYKMTTAEKKYVFSGSDIPREATYIKLNYSYKDYEFPTTQSGKTFSHVFGANTNPLEHFLIQKDIMGPCWLNLDQCTKLGNDLSWCALNIGLEDPQCCSVLQQEREAPPLNVMSLSLQAKISRLSQSNEVVAASVFFCQDVNVDTLDYTTGLNGFRNTIICLPPNVSYPEDAFEKTDREAQVANHKITLENSEFALLSRLLAAIHVYDPDIISGHNFFGGDLDILLTRMKRLRVPHWHKLGRLKSKVLPKTSGNADGAISSTYYQRLHMRGRIVCDTFEASQDLIKSKSFHLSELAKTQLDVIREDIKPHGLDAFYKTGHQLVALAKHCSLDAYLAFALMTKLQILPLTKQLTRLSGNLWSRSVHGARSERNEYLLLHAFYKKGYICPDKPVLQKKHSFEFVDEALELELPAAKRRLNANGKTTSFEGGLVLDPKTGIYDKYVLVLDFNSLYPSIMQEFNVCFTTMDVNSDENPAVEEACPSQDTVGILPALVKMFVDRRKSVKQLMNDPHLSATAKAQYHIEQMGLKLTANSMYGCLGSSYSRFFARPLAAFITSKGRDILRDTVHMAEQSNLDVIYGDTDSIMINTNQKVFSRANKIGLSLRDKVNAKYTMLEIDVDGVFRRTLLLKKKKYAAQVLTKQANGTYKEALEIKGLDIVRRDGCDLSRSTSERVLQLILSNQSQEAIISSLHDYIKMVGNKVHASEQLTKSPEEYRTVKGNPHVLVAKDMRRSGIAVKTGDTIPYIYCTKVTTDGVVIREPRMPDDVYSGKAAIDKDWYLLKQVLPSVDRICLPLEGIDTSQLKECLHINRLPPSNTDDDMQIDEVPAMGEEDEEDEESASEYDEEEEGKETNTMLANVFKIKGQHDIKRLELKCTACHCIVSSGLTCAACGASLSVANIYYQTMAAVRRFIQMYYDSSLECNQPACRFETRDQMPIDNECCLQLNCQGKLVRQYSAGQLYDQIASFTESIKHIGQNQDVSCILTMLETLTKRSAYNYIDFNSYM
ncbi:hypothetical protein PS6_000158 [Mucor atramentarius]